MRGMLIGEFTPLEGKAPEAKVDPLAYREGKKPFSVWLKEPAVRQIKVLAAQQGRTVQDLMEEILNRKFVECGMKPLA